MTEKRRLTDTELVDVLTHDIAITWADEFSPGPVTDEEKASIARLDRSARALISELRQRAFLERCQNRPPVGRRPIPERILAMTRDELLGQLRRLELGGQVKVQAAFRQFAHVDLDDLRSMLTDLEDTLGEVE